MSSKAERSKHEESVFKDIERAERYRQSIAGNPSYCTWPTYSETEVSGDERQSG